MEDKELFFTLERVCDVCTTDIPMCMTSVYRIISPIKDNVVVSGAMAAIGKGHQ